MSSQAENGVLEQSSEVLENISESKPSRLPSHSPNENQDDFSRPFSTTRWILICIGLYAITLLYGAFNCNPQTRIRS